jgi:selenophosphate synthetase-related protein
MTCDKRNTADILAIFAEEAVACAVIGEVTDTKRMQVTLNGEEATLFDFNSEIITGITKDALPK